MSATEEEPKIEEKTAEVPANKNGKIISSYLFTRS